MKTLTSLRLFAIALVSMLTFASLLQAKDDTKQEPTEINIKTSAYTFLCKNKIEETIKKLDGVEQVYLNLSDKIVTVKYYVGKQTQESLVNTIKNLGYTAELVKEEVSIDKKDMGLIWENNERFDFKPNDFIL